MCDFNKKCELIFQQKKANKAKKNGYVCNIIAAHVVKLVDMPS